MQDDSFDLLLVEDDAELALMVADFLSEHEFTVSIEGNGTRAVQRIESEPYDILVLDIGLPGMDGISICRTVRETFQGPILMLTARGDEIDEVISLEVGADDYLSKPVRPRALLARIRIHLRRMEHASEPVTQAKIEIGDLVIDAGSRTLTIAGQPHEITTAEFDLLWQLAVNAGKVVGRGQLYQKLHGMDYDGHDRSIDLRVSRLRRKLGDDPNHPQRIKSVRGVGYILAADS